MHGNDAIVSKPYISQETLVAFYKVTMLPWFRELHAIWANKDNEQTFREIQLSDLQV